MIKLHTALLLAVAAFLAAPMSAQEATEASTTSADLLAMRSKAGADPMLQRQFEQFERNFALGIDDNGGVSLEQYLLRNIGGIEISLNEPVRIATIGLLQPARNRAQAAGQILSSDLNGDWEITRDELIEALRYNRTDVPAAAFIIGDKDGNNVLSTEEIKVAVDDLARSQFGRGMQMPSLMVVFDFDGNGELSQAEVNRALTALTQGDP